MNRLLTLTMIVVGVLCGIAVAADGASTNYLVPMAAAGAMATLLRLSPVDL